MGFKVKTCYEIVCDGGCDGAWDDYDGIPHFDSEAEAVEHAKACDWLVAGDRMLCRRCGEKATCAATGHQWDEWCDAGQHGIQARRRLCDHCGTQEWDPPFDELYPKFQALRDAEELLSKAWADRGGDGRG